MRLPAIVGAVGLLGTVVEAAPRGSWFSSVRAPSLTVVNINLTVHSSSSVELLDPPTETPTILPAIHP